MWSEREGDLDRRTTARGIAALDRAALAVQLLKPMTRVGEADALPARRAAPQAR
jgi:hypothetical protein